MADSAFSTFLEAIKRADYLADLYHGLLNQRKKRIRSDWAAACCKLMHWSRHKKIDRVDGRDAMIVLRDGAKLKSSDFDSDHMADLLRASLVMATSALDAYFHAKVIAHVVESARRGKEMPKSLAARTMSFAEFVKSSEYSRRMTALRNSMNRQLGYESLQKPASIEQALSLIGVKDYFVAVARRMGCPVDGLKARLKGVVKRRNQIAHEGDLSQSKKTRNKPNVVRASDVTDAVGFVRRLVECSEKEINEQLER